MLPQLTGSPPAASALQLCCELATAAQILTVSLPTCQERSTMLEASLAMHKHYTLYSASHVKLHMHTPCTAP